MPMPSTISFERPPRSILPSRWTITLEKPQGACLVSHMSSLEAAKTSMDEVSGALVAIVLVLLAVFLPTLFLNGLSGAFYKQFAVTISVATAISLLVSLTLSPALAAVLLKGHEGEPKGPISRVLRRGADLFNHGFDRMSEGYSRLTRALVTRPKRMMVTYAGLIAATIGLFWVTPVGFIPAQDQGYFLTVIQLPPGSSLERTDEVMRKVVARILPIKGVKGSVMLAGFDGPSQTLAPNSAAAYVPLLSFEERKKLGVSYAEIMNEARKRTADINEAMLLVVPPPLIQGIGSAGGYRMMIEDRGEHGYEALGKTAFGLIGQANQTEGLKQVYSFFNTATPRVFADIDRRKANLLGVPPERVFEALNVYLGSTFVNDFNMMNCLKTTRFWHISPVATRSGATASRIARCPSTSSGLVGSSMNQGLAKARAPRCRIAWSTSQTWFASIISFRSGPSTRRAIATRRISSSTDCPTFNFT